MTAEAVYGEPPAALAASSPDALQVSPMVPGAAAIEDLASGSLSRLVVLAPAGAVERRYVLAQGLRALAEGGEMIALAPKDRGGSRLNKELAGFGCLVAEDARRHHRICHTRHPIAPLGLEAAIAEGAPRLPPSLGLWTQPGVFSWDRLDPGSALLLEHIDGLKGDGADLGCGIGVLALKLLDGPKISRLWCADIDRRALDAARRNISDPRVTFLHQDLRQPTPMLKSLDFVVMNPPFHEAGYESRGLGLGFISAAARMLRKGGTCRMVANIALPYEPRLGAEFSRFSVLAQGGGYKVYEAVK